MSATDTLELISQPWCNLTDLMKLAQIGRNSALKVRRDIKDKLFKQGYKLPTNLIPMNEVVSYLGINISYLESRIKTK